LRTARRRCAGLLWKKNVAPLHINRRRQRGCGGQHGLRRHLAAQDSQVKQRHMRRGGALLPRRMARLAKHQRPIQRQQPPSLGVLGSGARGARHHASKQQHNRQQPQNAGRHISGCGGRRQAHIASVGGAGQKEKVFFFLKKEAKVVTLSLVALKKKGRGPTAAKPLDCR
jgi:hypothetical protein